MSLIFLDTETTGFSKNGFPKQPDQARVCQIAMLLTDAEGKSLGEFSALIKPEGWQIQESAAAVHGFTNEQCEQYGVSAKAIYNLYLKWAEMATKIIAHNVKFDQRMMEIEAAYNDMPQSNKQWYCTMEASAPIVNIPSTAKMLAAGFNKPKSPKLEEALQFLCGRGLGDTAHDAMYDVKACRDIYFELKKRNAI